ncbi:MAG: hypothetical protein EZS28_017845 [Streblomastix strix]|uniref:Uncharacterized protein n=1 Tax=Streblomastix strix TaxID=222440 RepID=A0A5J4VWH1_9EUKA|nr:MAG: hypothetical protein EZS28_017845 [Streblomastix strix]
MGFFSKIANFGSKVLGGVKHAAQWIAPTLHKVLNTVAGPVGMIHPGIGAALGAGSNLTVYAANNQIIDGQASDFALKIAPDVNQLQSTVGSIDADIVGVKNDIDIIKQELARQQHFRGYYLLNSDITSLPDSADGDFAFSAESGTVWMYDTTWYNSGYVVPDQISPASDAVPLVDSATGAAGTSTEYSRGDHQHPLQISTVQPSADTATGEAGTAATYARSDHTHHVNLINDVQLKDSGTGTAVASNIYANAVHQHPLNIDPTVANVPLVNATAASNGTSDFYCRNDHVHPQQLTYDGNITATKFIKTGGLATEILCANGDTTTIDSKLSRAYNSGTGGNIRLCVFLAGTSTGAPYIQFQVQCNTNAMQTIDLVPNYSTNGIVAFYGVFTAPSYIQTIYNVYYGVDQLLHTHTGTGSSAVYTAWIHMMSGSGMVTVSVSKQGTYWPTRVTEILTSDIVSSISGSQTQIPMTFNLGSGGIIGDMLQVNSLDQNYNYYNNGIRIGNNNGDSTASLYLGCIKTATNTTQSGQWEISNTGDKALTINPSSLRKADHSVVGTPLYINQRGISLSSQFPESKLVQNYVLNAGSSDSFAGVKCGAIQIIPTVNNFNEGIRISRSTISNYSGKYLGCDPNSTTGTIAGQ